MCGNGEDGLLDFRSAVGLSWHLLANHDTLFDFELASSNKAEEERALTLDSATPVVLQSSPKVGSPLQEREEETVPVIHVRCRPEACNARGELELTDADLMMKNYPFKEFCHFDPGRFGWRREPEEEEARKRGGGMGLRALGGAGAGAGAGAGKRAAAGGGEGGRAAKKAKGGKGGGAPATITPEKKVFHHASTAMPMQPGEDSMADSDDDVDEEALDAEDKRSLDDFTDVRFVSLMGGRGTSPSPLRPPPHSAVRLLAEPPLAAPGSSGLIFSHRLAGFVRGKEIHAPVEPPRA